MLLKVSTTSSEALLYANAIRVEKNLLYYSLRVGQTTDWFYDENDNCTKTEEEFTFIERSINLSQAMVQVYIADKEVAVYGTR